MPRDSIYQVLIFNEVLSSQVLNHVWCKINLRIITLALRSYVIWLRSSFASQTQRRLFWEFFWADCHRIFEKICVFVSHKIKVSHYYNDNVPKIKHRRENNFWLVGRVNNCIFLFSEWIRVLFFVFFFQ